MDREGRDASKETRRHLDAAAAAQLLAGLPVASASILDRGDLAAAPVIACIPACREEAWMPRCLDALMAELRPGDGVVLVVNGSDDRTASIAAERLRAGALAFRLIDLAWHEGEGSAPQARRIALDLADAANRAAILLSLDADTRVLPGYRAAYRAEFDRGFDLVCGRIGFDPEEAAQLPEPDPDHERIIRDYRTLSRRLAALIAPDADNPFPHHGNIGGANFAVRAQAYRAAGRLPLVPFGEDRALRRAVEARGLRIRYSDGPRVETSCRLVGRASGGLSDELRRNRLEADPIVDEALEPPERLALRLRLRAAFASDRSRSERQDALALLDLAPLRIAALLSDPLPVRAFQAAEEESPRLLRRRLTLSDLRRHLPALRALVAETEDARPDSRPSARG
ncbi:glycosyltransferase family 2 protein [Aurantimonas sp. Leaf443]|uniref:glycosyltransferase n=1 Tax=Aurantimonas sp. Leaf443 TaxID=1736378 RepID=UPI00138F646A|nr:glycosyltransferase family 2 protein [Aurantimonas sp. Leaf443]